MVRAYPGNPFATWLECELRRRDFYPSLAKAERETEVGASSLHEYIHGAAYPNTPNIRKLAKALQTTPEAIRRKVDEAIAEGERAAMPPPDLPRAPSDHTETARLIAGYGFDRLTPEELHLLWLFIRALDSRRRDPPAG